MKQACRWLAVAGLASMSIVLPATAAEIPVWARGHWRGVAVIFDQDIFGRDFNTPEHVIPALAHSRLSVTDSTVTATPYGVLQLGTAKDISADAKVVSVAQAVGPLISTPRTIGRLPRAYRGRASFMRPVQSAVLASALCSDTQFPPQDRAEPAGPEHFEGGCRPLTLFRFPATDHLAVWENAGELMVYARAP